MNGAAIPWRWREIPHLFRVSPADPQNLLSAGVAIGCLWGLDVFTTALGLSLGAVETGPVPKILLSHGIEALIVAKAGGVLGIMTMAWRVTAQGNRRFVFWALTGVVVISFGIIVWNVSQLFVVSRLIP